jgi:hypothetical protein
MPQGQKVGWDIPSYDPVPGPPEWILAVYLVLGVAFVAISALRLWAILGLTSESCVWHLNKSVLALFGGSLEELRESADKFRARGPEGGLREWQALPPESLHEDFLGVVRDADRRFCAVMAQAVALLSGFRRLMQLGGIVVAAWLFAGLGSLFALASAEKSLHAQIVCDKFVEVLRGTGLAVCFVCAVYAVYWHFSARLERRRLAWDYFRANVGQASSTSSAEEKR